MIKVRYVVGCMFAAAGLAANVEGVVVAGWDVAGVDVAAGIGIETNGAPYTFRATTSGVSHVDAALALGPGVTPSTTAGQYGFKIPGAGETNSLDGALAAEHYLEFSITVDRGYQLNLESVEMVGQGTAGGCSNIVLMTSLDGFSAGEEIASAYPVNDTGGFDTDESGFGGPIDLSASTYQNLSGSIMFRIYGWNSTSGNSPTYIRNLTGDDLMVHGNVVAVSGTGVPVLSVEHTNGMASLMVEFDGASTTNYVLQRIGSLADSNGWAAISSPFSSSTNWTVEITNAAAFYRVVPE